MRSIHCARTSACQNSADSGWTKSRTSCHPLPPLAPNFNIDTQVRQGLVKDRIVMRMYDCLSTIKQQPRTTKIFFSLFSTGRLSEKASVTFSRKHGLTSRRLSRFHEFSLHFRVRQTFEEAYDKLLLSRTTSSICSVSYGRLSYVALLRSENVQKTSRGHLPDAF